MDDARLARTLEHAVADLDLSLAQYRVLTILSRGSEGAAALAAKLAARPASVTAVVVGLVARGLVTRQVDAADRRKVTHVVSESGTALLRSARSVAAAKLHEISAHLGDTERSSAWDGLDLWHEALSSYRPSRKADQALAR